MASAKDTKARAEPQGPVVGGEPVAWLASKQAGQLADLAARRQIGIWPGSWKPYLYPYLYIYRYLYVLDPLAGWFPASQLSGSPVIRQDSQPDNRMPVHGIPWIPCKSMNSMDSMDFH